MYRIIPFFIFFAAITYLFNSPAPMDKIGLVVKTRDCYQLRLMDQERLSLSSEKINDNDHPTASTQKNDPFRKTTSIEEYKRDNFSLAFSQQGQ